MTLRGINPARSSFSHTHSGCSPSSTPCLLAAGACCRRARLQSSALPRTRCHPSTTQPPSKQGVCAWGRSNHPHHHSRDRAMYERSSRGQGALTKRNQSCAPGTSHYGAGTPVHYGAGKPGNQAGERKRSPLKVPSRTIARTLSASIHPRTSCLRSRRPAVLAAGGAEAAAAIISSDNK